jgi:hypothetical protein
MVRKAVLAAETAMSAEAELDALSEDDLRELLSSSSPW